MTVALATDGRILLAGNCGVEDAEILVRHLLVDAKATLDWSACESAHTAVIQVLLAAGAKPVGGNRRDLNVQRGLTTRLATRGAPGRYWRIWEKGRTRSIPVLDDLGSQR